MNDETVKKLQADVNGQIARACKDRSGFEWQGIAERIVHEELPSDRWEYVWATYLGRPPEIAITQYRSPE